MMTVVDRRRALVAALRSPPPGLIWDYAVAIQETACGTRGCAIAVAAELWPENFHQCIPMEDIGRFFGLSAQDVCDVFFGDYGVNNAFVTPEMVADRLGRLE